MGMVTRILKSMMLWCKDEVCGSWALPCFLDANSVERVAISFLYSNVERHPKDYFRPNVSHQEYLFKESYAIGLTQKTGSLAKVGCMASTSRRGLLRLSLVFWGVSIFPNFLVRGLTILGPQKVCRLVLSLIGWGRGLVSRIPGWRLKLGHGGVGEAITLGETLIFSRIALSWPWSKADVLLERIDWGWAFT